ncbi:hypothetical protein AXK61_20190 [Tsukamurella pseudospumae]|uniref:Uncharacterized protein n=2 Tax=Tsukamurella pseudospumae TaxID=239498 RepID=A0A137ZJH4_9ACTN|nr:hypothetical protein AXK61_20190 [Tsukamurella pseudospumae]
MPGHESAGCDNTMTPSTTPELLRGLRIAITLLLVLILVALSAAGLLTPPSVQRYRRTLRGVTTTMLNDLDRDLAAYDGPVPAELREAHHAAHEAHRVAGRRGTQRNVERALTAAFAARDVYDDVVSGTGVAVRTGSA